MLGKKGTEKEKEIVKRTKTRFVLYTERRASIVKHGVFFGRFV
ncbi:hypothetical protein SSU98_1432 [Streptococcus suis 98HAH33]|nr:hypothetical protein SSU05_1420 [Streptococcus suis 05ZYH33]ABP92590.1 hypothetical protein SSU98_1432 [Streptococcus suis 98HAH33]